MESHQCPDSKCPLKEPIDLTVEEVFLPMINYDFGDAYKIAFDALLKANEEQREKEKEAGEAFDARLEMYNSPEPETRAKVEQEDFDDFLRIARSEIKRRKGVYKSNPTRTNYEHYLEAKADFQIVQQLAKYPPTEEVNEVERGLI